MVTVRSYQKPEKAYIDAGYLCSLGLNACVSQDPAFGGMLFGAVETPYRLQVTETEVERAQALLAEADEEGGSSVPIEVAPALVKGDGLHLFFRFALVYELVCVMAFAMWGESDIEVLPLEVQTHLNGLAFSIGLWEFAYLSFWPLLGVTVLSSLMCFFYHPTGRMLFAFSTIWGLVTQLGPPVLLGPLQGFLWNSSVILSSMALALMYWSPLSERFNRGLQE